MRYADFPDIQPNAQRTADNVPVDVRILSRPFAGVPENNRGQSVILSAVTNDNFTPVIETKHGGEDAEMMTIGLGYEVVNPTSTVKVQQKFNIKANIQWGVGGSTLEAVVDVQQGTFIRVPAQTIRVSVNYKNASLTPDQIRFTAQVGYGNVVARTSNARYTQVLPAIAPANILPAYVANIPAFASSFSIYTDSAGMAPGVPIPLGVYVGGLTGVFFYIPDATLPSQENQIVIPQAGIDRYIQIFNNSGVAVEPIIVYSMTL